MTSRGDHTSLPTDPAATDAYLLDEDDVLDRFGSRRGGLTSDEVAEHRAAFGDNVIVEVHSESLALRFLRQFKDWIIILLLACAAITAYLGDALTSVVLVLLVLINTSIGFFQEYRSGKTMEALQHLSLSLCQVERDGVLTELDSTELVVGDVVLLAEGAAVPADIRLIEASAFSTNEFALTGESDPTRKYSHRIATEVAVAEQHNTAHAGTTVATGEAVGVVVATGTRSELGRIARLAEAAPQTSSPLQREMGHIGRIITYAAVTLSLALLVVAVWADLPLHEAVLFAVGFASAVIPQGLPAEVNTALAQAAAALAESKTLVKRLSAVETLGSTEVICTDKTGTLTKNEMTVTEIVAAGRDFVAHGTGYEPTGDIRPTAADPFDRDRLVAFLLVGVLASDARLLPPDDEHRSWHVLGDPTEGALLTVAAKAGIDPQRERAAHRRLREFPFDSARKLMTTIRTAPDGAVTAYVKGAPESVVARASRIDEGGSIRPITEVDRQEFLAAHIRSSDRGLRNLAYATRPATDSDVEAVDPQLVESDLILLGFVSMVDPIRDQVPEAMRRAIDARIKVNIITGDFARTAEAVARKAGLDHDHGMVVVTEQQLRAMSDDEVLARALDGGTVFSRVDPTDKTRIVELVKRSGRVVAVTGDGINDAPALRHASIGVAMGASGTDVAKEAAEIVLLDDSFSTLVRAVEQGRVIYANISKGVISCLTSNAAELVVNMASLILATVAGLPLAINVMQILAIDLLGELLPIAALGRDPEEGSVMKRPPRDPKARIVNLRSIRDLLYVGSIMGVLAIGNYLLFYEREGSSPFAGPVDPSSVAGATTMTYVTVLVCQLFNITQRRSEGGLFTRYTLSNPTYWIACAAGVAIMLAIVYVPWLQAAFKTGPLAPMDWAFVMAAAAIFVAVREGGRLLRQRRRTPNSEASVHAPADGSSRAPSRPRNTAGGS
ncbi:cation-translocating P-type ATPase [Microbacterium sulfonylureivorans]|uniref:cation-translocating P-type ATPase n=1 Tax=Microbacterium sulfonylureivorans TaxID=2486854 RepID=UPI000FD6F182|nr:cation-transporting P-type ATPase [Microbacterium sulfonylureivorans]